MTWNTRTVAELEAELIAVEAEISESRARQTVLVNELDRAQAPQSDGSRSMVEWVQAHLDIDTTTARDLVLAARRIGWHRHLSDRLITGTATFPRIIATLKYADTGATSSQVRASFDRDLHGVARLTATRRRITPRDEHDMFTGRYFTIQPTLDESSYRMWGQLPGVMGRTVEKALDQRGDELPRPPDHSPTRGQRNADALATMAMDSLKGTDTATDAAPPQIAVFIDATTPDDTASIDSGTARDTATIAYGPRIGPNTLEGLLCSGRIQVIGMDGGTPLVTSRGSRTIPRAIRHAVMYRDGGCTIDGCGSRYRLEPHHITPWSHGGNHTVDNLTTLCWYHHHVAIHGEGYRIDPDTPPLRRRLLRTRLPTPAGADPP
jgi:hypothetical protein